MLSRCSLHLQVPVLQMVELLETRPCKMVVCGRGSAAAVAQQTAFELQHLLRVPNTTVTEPHQVHHVLLLRQTRLLCFCMLPVLLK